MTHKLLVVCGPTATGKTNLAIRLAQKFNGEIVSADARQIYKGLHAATGKQYSDTAVIHGYDMIDPDQSFSVSQYISFAQETIATIQNSDKLPFLVGGTGFYIKGVIDGIPTAFVAPNEMLRYELSQKDVEFLYGRLHQLSSVKAESLNESDRKNPRRLIRAIEILESKEDHSVHSHSSYDLLMIGLTAPLSILEERIEKNIEKRFDQTIAEIEGLLKKGIDWTAPAMNSLGVRQLRLWFEKKVSIEEAKKLWTLEERKYVKRQLTWFKKDTRIKWFDITDSEFFEKVDHLVETWDNKK